MDVDLRELSPNVRYKLLTALVIPRPIAWITSLDAAGRVNAAPYSFFNVLGNEPPLVAFGPGNKAPHTPKDTATNVEETQEFVINLVDREGAQAMHQSAAPFPAEMSEVEALGLETLPSRVVRAPRLAISRVQLECRFCQKIEIGKNRVLFGTVEYIHVPDGWIDPQTHHITPGVFQAIGRLQGPGWYTQASEPFNLGPYPPIPDALPRPQE